MHTSLTTETYQKHYHWMGYALKLAQTAANRGDIPVGAVIVDNKGKLIASAANRKEKEQESTAHAEIIAIRTASKVLGNWHLNQCTLYVTLEPCPMCTGAIIQARIGLLVYGLDDPKTGTILTVANLPNSACSNHHLSVIAGIRERECRHLLHNFFEQKRAMK